MAGTSSTACCRSESSSRASLCWRVTRVRRADFWPRWQVRVRRRHAALFQARARDALRAPVLARHDAVHERLQEVSTNTEQHAPPPPACLPSLFVRRASDAPLAPARPTTTCSRARCSRTRSTARPSPRRRPTSAARSARTRPSSGHPSPSGSCVPRVRALDCWC